MIPTFLRLGLVVGMLGVHHRKVAIVTVLVCSLLVTVMWAILESPPPGLGNAVGVFLVGATNGIAGTAIAMMFACSVVRLPRYRKRPNRDPA